MKRELLDRILSRGLDDEDLDVAQFLSDTEKVPIPELDHFRWQEVQFLFVLGDRYDRARTAIRKRKGLKPGWYTDDLQMCMFGFFVPEDQIVKYVARCSSELEGLSLRYTSVRNLDLSNVPNLSSLDLEYNSRLSEVFHMDRLEHLEGLSVAVNPIGPTLDLNGYRKLRYVNISSSDIVQIDLNHVLPDFHVFTAYNTKLQNVDFIKYCPELDSLDLRRSPISDLSLVKHCTKLTRLNLGTSPVKHLPDAIRTLKRLKYLDLSGVTLDELPDWLPELGLNFETSPSYKGVCLWRTQIKGIDMSIFDQPQDVILKWFEERKKMRKSRRSQTER